jgi:hypothetical protein
MSNSTAVAATIGVGALGVLAYYGYQNLGGKTDDVQVGELYNDIDNTATDGEEKDLQTQAKEEVAKAVKTGMNAWSGFWQNEYDDINGAQDEASAADVVTQKNIQIEKEE